MSSIFAALETIAGVVAPQIYARQKSGLPPSSLGYGATVPELERWDRDILTAIDSHIIFVDTALDNAAGELFSWPFSEDDALAIWTSKTPEQIAKVMDDIARLAAESVLRRVYADLRTQADTRAGLPFSAQGKSLTTQADAFLELAVAKITGALKLLTDSGNAGGSEGGSGTTSQVSGIISAVPSW